MASLFRSITGNNSGDTFELAMLAWVETHRKTLIRTAVIGSLLLLTAAASLLASHDKITYAVILAAIPLLAFGLLYLQAHLDLAPILILITAGFIPFGFSTGTGSRLVASLVLACVVTVVWILRMAVVEKRFSLKPSAANLPGLGFIAAVLISLVWSNIFRDPSVFVPSRFLVVQIAAGTVMVVSPVVLLLVGNFISRDRQLKAIVAVMMAIGIIGAIFDLSHVSLPVNNDGLTNTWVIAMAVCLGLFNARLSKGVRLLLLAIAGFYIFWGFVINLSWVAGWLPGLVAVGVITFFRSKRLLVALLVLLAVYSVLNYKTLKTDFIDERTTSGDTRLAAWQVNWSVTSQHLIFGTGPAGYAVYYMTYNPSDAMATHNNYIDLISQTGLLGTFFYLWFFAALIWRSLVVINRLRGKRDFREALAVGVLGGTIGCLVIMAFGDWLLPFAYTQTIAGFNYSVYCWLFMGVTLALDHMTREEAQPKTAVLDA
jgi:O-antigen ligase